MCTHKSIKEGTTFLFFFYSPEQSFKIRRTFYTDEQVTVVIDGKYLKTVSKLRFSVLLLEKELQIEEHVISPEGYCMLQTKEGESVLTVPVREKPVILSCSRLSFLENRIIKIGADFSYELFYEYGAFLKGIHFSLSKKEGVYRITCRGEKEAFLYLNGNRVHSEHILQKGDRVEILGLCLRVLPEMILCTAFFGTLRTVQRKEELEPVLTACEQRESSVYKGRGSAVREAICLEEKLQEEELELELPEVVRQNREQPFILAVGPSVTMIIPVLVMVILSNARMAQSGGNFYEMTAAMTVASAVLTVFWTMLGRSFRRKTAKREEARQKREYLTYLQKIESYLSSGEQKYRQNLQKMHLSAAEIIKEGWVFWESSDGKTGQQLVRMGTGSIPFPIRLRMPYKKYTVSRNFLIQEAYDIVQKYQVLTEVPVGVVLTGGKCTGIAGEKLTEAVLQMLVQLAAYNKPQQLKVVLFYHEENPEEKRLADCIKWLPHLWKEGQKRRFLAGNEKEAGELLPVLKEQLQNRAEGAEKEEFYVFVILAPELIKGEELYRVLLTEEKEQTYHTVFVQKRKEQIPGAVSVLVQNGRKGMLRIHAADGFETKEFSAEGCKYMQAEHYMRMLADAASQEGKQDLSLPERVSFLELYGCKKAEDLHCLTRWRENEAAKRIRVPIGMEKGGKILCLDIHEKFHGPHGLVAGTTGSGKSELLQTYLLSLAVSFSAEVVNFFIIDYKGGGMGHMLCELPHCAGVISNLSGHQVKRALLSLKSEIFRRQRILSEAGVSHVDEYAELQRNGQKKEPLAHLIIVVDEFAELKKEEPEFMQEVISMAQIGRSLGMHLILATQKPAGTVDDKIWSNTRFRLCLRVADRQDSMDMLHRTEAAYLTGAGRCYLQIGNHELFTLFQTGYCKAPYREKEKEKAALVLRTGKRIRGCSNLQNKGENQLEYITGYINAMSVKGGYLRARRLWMEELPKELILEQLLKPDVKEEKNPANRPVQMCLGKYDDPERQRQALLIYEPLKDSHLCVCGMPATGKSTFLQTMLWQVVKQYNPEKVQFLLMVSENAGIKVFQAMPHCIGIWQGKEENECFFYHLNRFVKQRKAQLQGIPYEQYCKKIKQVLPLILLVIDDYGMFRRETGDKEQQAIEQLTKEGAGLGIYLVITTLGIHGAEMPFRLFENIKNALTFEMSEKVQYGDILRQYSLSVLPRKDVKGRGLCKIEDRILEFQAPVLAAGDDYTRMEQIEKVAGQLQKAAAGLEDERMQTAYRFPMIPQEPYYEELLRKWKHNNIKKEKEDKKWLQEESRRMQLPLGYLTENGYMQEISINEHFPFLISGEARTGKRNVLACIQKGLVSLGIKTVVWKVETWKNDLEEDSSSEGTISAWLILNLSVFVHVLNQEKEKAPEQVKKLEQKLKRREIIPVAILETKEEAQLSGSFWYEMFYQRQCGIHMGGHAGAQRLFLFDDLGYSAMSQKEAAGTGYLKLGNKSGTKRIRIPLAEKEEADDFSRY